MAESPRLDTEYGLSRSSANMRFAPTPTSSIVHALKPQERVQILAEAGDMLEVESARWTPPVRGFVPRAAILRKLARPGVFPAVDLGGGISVPAVPISLPLSAFLRWLESSDESPWLPAVYAGAIRRGQHPSIGKRIRDSIARNRAAWDAWVAEVRSAGREATSTLDEWVTRMQGGRDMWSIRAERLFADPSEHSATLGWVAPEDVLRWTGSVRVNDREPKYRIWYEVELAKADKHLIGWYKASLLDEFFSPTARTDLAYPANREKVFDLTRPRLRLPADFEISDSRKAGRAAAQFIDVRRALGWGQLHHNLCGEFCAAALASTDVIPLLQEWLRVYPPARGILAEDRGTSIPDLQAMLNAFGLKHEFYRTVGSTSPVTPNYVRRKLDAGMMGIVGTGVTRSGAIRARSGIRHWIVIEDILRVGSSGWLRVFNPFTNREETYRFDEVYDLPSRDSIGLWVEPRRPGILEINVAVSMAVPTSVAAELEPALSD
jgi:hypothetical protein